MKKDKKIAQSELKASIRNLLAALDEETTDVVEETKPEENLVAFDLEEGENKFATEMGVTASMEQAGIEDQIKDTAKGGDPTVKEIVDYGKDAEGKIESDKAVFPTKSDKVTTEVEKVAPILEAKVAKVLSALDEAADEYEKCGDLTAALALDVCADNIEAKFKR